MIAVSALATPALAQDDAGGQACQWSVGIAANTAPPARSFSLLTPEGAWSVSPVLGSQCSPTSDLRWHPWAGVDLVPTLQHSYRRLAERSSLFVLARAGMDLSLYRDLLRVGLHLTTNVTAWGFGVRLRLLDPPKVGPSRTRLGVHGLELRVDLLAGETPDVQASLRVHVHDRWVGNRSEERARPPLTWRQARPWHVATGFELGTITGLRVQLTPGAIGPTPEIGLRGGALTNLFADAAVQPLALAYVDVPLSPDAEVQPQIGVHAGVTRRDGRAGPLGGVVFELDPMPVPFQIHLGLLVGVDDEGVYQSIDAGMGALW